jgi:hypothetical protein
MITALSGRAGATCRVFGAAVALAAWVFVAQPLWAQSVHAGLKGGASIASFHGADDDDDDWRTGFTAGAFLTYRFHRYVALQPEFVFTQKGAKASISDDEVGTIDADAKLDYFELPLLLRIMAPLGRSGSNMPYAVLGPTVGFESGCEVEGKAAGVSMSFDCSELDADVKSVDYGAVFGGGWTFPVYSAQVSLDGRYVLMLSDFDESDETTKNQSFAITLGVALPVWQGPRSLTMAR